MSVIETTEVVEEEELDREFAAPQPVGVRPGTYASVVTGMDPARLGQILENAGRGDNIDFLTLAEEMEERDPHYGAVLQTRKLAVAGLEPFVTAASDSPAATAQAERVLELVRRPEFRSLLFGLLDGIAKGYGVVEILWNRTPDRWEPKQYFARNPRHFQYDFLVPDTLRLRDIEDPAHGIPVPLYKFLCHVPNIRAGLPARGGLARTISAIYLAKGFLMRTSLIYSELYGIPARIGRHPKTANKEDIAKLKRALKKLGTDASAVIGEGTSIEFLDAAKGADGSKLFRNLLGYFDEQTSKAVLGQTMTTDNGSSLAQAQVHERVRQDIVEADSKAIADTVNRDLIRPYIDLNDGPPPDGRYPVYGMLIEDVDDIGAMTDALKELVPLGLRVSESEVLDKLGFTKPEDGVDILTAPEPAPRQPPRGDANRQVDPHQQRHHDAIDQLNENLDKDWEKLLGPIVAPIQKLAETARSAAEFRRRLPTVLGTNSNPDPFLEAIAMRMFESRGIGDAVDDPRKR